MQMLLLVVLQVPRVALTEMGPALHMVLRRHRLPAVDMEKEALKQPKMVAKKVSRGGVRNTARLLCRSS
jgi:hypothetical protein